MTVFSTGKDRSFISPSTAGKVLTSNGVNRNPSYQSLPAPPVVPSFVDGEVPTGTVDGSNVTFTLAHAPNPGESLLLVLVGASTRVLQIQGTDYTLSGVTITFGAAPASGSLVAWYRH